MTLAPVYMDVTELVLHPLRTGIQRIEREKALPPARGRRSDVLLPLPTASDGCLETYSGSHSLIEKSWRAVVKWGE